MADSDRLAITDLRREMLRGLVIPAHPLALTYARKLDERRQAALTRYYCDAGAGGIAVGVHTTQFAIRDPAIALLEPVLTLARRTVDSWSAGRESRPVLIAGAVGPTAQAVREAELAAALGYDAVLLSLGALRDAANPAIIEHCQRVAEVIPIVGFYLQPAVGGRVLDREFWKQFLEIENIVAIKVAPFDRYRTLDVVTALAESGRRDVALYTGNDDSIVADLVTPFSVGSQRGPLWFSGGLLGQWAVWTKAAADMLRHCHAQRHRDGIYAEVPDDDAPDTLRLLALGAQLTDANAALFDPANRFAGCIPGIHEILRRQGLLAGRWCLDPEEDLSPGQLEAIDRVLELYPHLTDDGFVKERLDSWLD